MRGQARVWWQVTLGTNLAMPINGATPLDPSLRLTTAWACNVETWPTHSGSNFARSFVMGPGPKISLPLNSGKCERTIKSKAILECED